ncbi:uncharacterized protein LOC133831705 [Humulus lupulus]|uniref:uncharacterized protein LOC133831705 n=1 Tax=Humulus lupulus TaxID=3486 RepID=UPI002B410F66|nr:uncharacterized protein LOC133831705 [Humulus lupulus]XP_062118085.1 uncharacterized protein LOC133831705 [Humulus lupulus]
MDLSEEWKSLFPISAVFRSPLLLSSPSTKPILGPLVFNPIPNTISCLFFSSSLLPPCHPFPQLSFPQFLLTSSFDSSLPPSTSSSIISVFGPNHHQTNVASNFLNNRLELLRCPGTNNLIIFFPTGENSDQIGFLLLQVKNSCFKVCDNGDVFVASLNLKHQILRISVNPVLDSSSEFSTLRENSFCTIGYLLACTLYSIHWYVIKVKEIGSNTEVPTLTHLGSKVFKTCCIVHACWSPHLPEESIILLENGALFLFDMECSLKTDGMNANCKGTRLKVSWDDSSHFGDHKWLSCEFSWHPRIFIVARSDAVYIVDFRLDQCSVNCLAKIEMLRTYSSIGNERFLAVKKAGPDGFHFALASNSLLLLCDVRKPLTPVLQWAHRVSKPCYIDVFRLSDLRSNLQDDMYRWASDSGFCIIVGSFWNCEFNLFCYGPPSQALNGSRVATTAKFDKSYYAWGYPSNLLLSGHECPCGSCLVKEEFLKDDLPAWIDWQRKKEVILGFGIINKDLFSLVSKPDEFGGFMLVRLLSSGKLELQRYSASWESIELVEEPHKKLSQFKDYLMFPPFDEEYKFPKIYNYLDLGYLNSYLNDNLDEIIVSKMKLPYTGSQVKESFTLEFHEILCEKLNACGLSRSRSSPAVTVVFNDISLPSSIHEVALRRLWADLPVDFLQMAFSNYSEFLEVLVGRHRMCLEFLAVPDQPQLPPFILRNPSLRSNKWSQKVQPPDVLVGPLLPLPILLALHEFHNGCRSSEEQSSSFAAEAELRHCCDEVMQVAREVANSDFASELHKDHVVSLADDREELVSETAKPFFLHHPSAFNTGAINHTEEQSAYKDEVYGTLISKVSEEHASVETMETVGLELFDSVCPIKLRFDDASAMKFESKELKAYKLLKKQFSKWQGDFDLYTQFVSMTKHQN